SFFYAFVLSSHTNRALPYAPTFPTRRSSDLHHILEFFVCFDFGKCHGPFQGLFRGHHHGCPRIVFWVGKMFACDGGDPHNSLFLAGMIEERLVALFHCLEVAAGLAIPDSIPNRFDFLFLILPGVGARPSLYMPLVDLSFFFGLTKKSKFPLFLVKHR